MSSSRLLGFCVVFAAIVVFSSCDAPFSRDKQSFKTFESDADERIAQYQNKIKKNRNEFQQAIQAAGRIARFNKLLAIQYMEVGMFGLALDSLQEALLVEPQNEVLFYLSGIAAMRLAKIYPVTDGEYGRLIGYAEHALQQSLELSSDYADALFALSMLYVFDKGESHLALPLLERLRSIGPSNPHTHALIGRVQMEYDDFAEAAQSYQRAAELYDESEYRQKSLDNLAVVESLQRGVVR